MGGPGEWEPGREGEQGESVTGAGTPGRDEWAAESEMNAEMAARNSSIRIHRGACEPRDEVLVAEVTRLHSAVMKLLLQVATVLASRMPPSFLYGLWFMVGRV